jgi:hypothetical protein
MPIPNGKLYAIIVPSISIVVALACTTTPHSSSLILGNPLILNYNNRNDILRKHKIIPEKPPSPTPMIEEALTEARRLAHENRLEGKELDELAALEDEEDEDFLEFYR